MIWDKIVNPETGRNVSIYGKIGKKILNNYVLQMKGGMICDGRDCPKGWCHTDSQMAAVINRISNHHLGHLPTAGRISFESGIIDTIPGSEVISVPFKQSERLGGWCIPKNSLNLFNEFCNMENWNEAAHGPWYACAQIKEKKKTKKKTKTKKKN